MKITVWGINYQPEPTGIGPFNTDMCVWLAERGHDVAMVTSFPYYPWWKKRPEDKGRIYAKEQAKGVRIFRCWHYVPAKPSTLKRLIHELSFVTFSTLRVLMTRRPDVFVVVGPPLFLGIGAWFASRILRRPYVFHVQDLQPDAAVGLGMIKPGLATKALYALEKWTYRKAALVTGISEGMIAAFRRKQLADEKIYLFPNWIPDAENRPETKTENHAASFRGEYGIAGDAALIAYSGNVGVKQGLEVVIEAAGANGSNGHQKVHWAICGDGAAKADLEARVAATPGCAAKLYPIQPDDLYQALLREADVNLITQQRGTGQFFFPSKLLSILQHGRPVLAVADDDSELSRAVREGGFGIVISPGDARTLRTAAAELAGAEPQHKRDLGEKGRVWVSQFRRNHVLGAFEARLKRLIGRS